MRLLSAVTCITIALLARTSAAQSVPTNPTFPSSYPTLTGARRFLSGPTSTSIDLMNRMMSRMSVKGLERIGGTVETEDGARKWVVNGHSYSLNDGVDERQDTGPVGASIDTNPTGGGGGGGRIWVGEATREGPHHAYVDTGMSELSPTEDGEAGSVDVTEAKEPPPPSTVKDWTKDWQYSAEDWFTEELPDPSFPGPALPRPADVLVVVSNNNTVQASRDVSGLANATLHYLFYLSDNQDQDTEPQLKVYHVAEGTRTLLQQETQHGEWYSRTLDVPQANDSKIIFEALRADSQDVIALSNVRIAGEKLSQEEPTDSQDQTTTTTTTDTTQNTTTPAEGTAQNTTTTTDEGNSSPNTTAQSNPSTPVQTEYGTQNNAEETQTTNTTTTVPTGDDPTPGNTTATGEGENNNSTAPVPPSQTLTDGEANTETESTSSNSTAQSAVTSPEQETAGSKAETSDFESSTVSPDGETDTPLDTDAGIGTDADFSSTTANAKSDAADAYSDTDEGISTIDPFLNTEDSVANTEIDPMVTGNQQARAPNQTDTATETPSETTSEENSTSSGFASSPQTNGTAENITVTTIPGLVSPSPAGNSTEEVVKGEASPSTSWRVFQVFLVLCVLGFLALGFVYLKRKRRQDDEIPVFTRHTDYLNPTFNMEDATNFMSRVGRNSYKTLD